MLTKEFNELLLPERKLRVFGEGKLINIFEDNKIQKVFFFKMEDLKIDVIYDKIHNLLIDIKAWENNNERVKFLKLETVV